MADNYEEIVLIETDASKIVSNLISSFEEYLGEKLYDGDERKIFLQSFAYPLAETIVNINETGKSNLLRYAKGDVLDELANLYGNARLEAQYAETTIKITISASQNSDIVIPKGTRVTPDGYLLFAIDEDVIFSANTTNLSKEVGATATVAGAEYNNIEVGMINRLVDGSPYVSRVENTTVSSGGDDVETDDEFRERLRLSPFTFSVAGPSNAYRSIALAVSSDIQDVSVYSPSAGVVEIAFVKNGGIIPNSNDELVNSILEACNDKDVRPLTDNVRVVPATAHNMAIQVDYYVSNNDISKMGAIVSAVEEYKSWQTEKIGRSINPDKLKYMMMDAGASKVDIISPAYAELEQNEIAKITSTVASYKGSITE